MYSAGTPVIGSYSTLTGCRVTPLSEAFAISTRRRGYVMPRPGLALDPTSSLAAGPANCQRPCQSDCRSGAIYMTANSSLEALKGNGLHNRHDPPDEGVHMTRQRASRRAICTITQELQPAAAVRVDATCSKLIA